MPRASAQAPHAPSIRSFYVHAFYLHASPMPLGLYLHVPFCSAICNYCNFNRGLLDAGLKARYVRGARGGDPGRVRGRLAAGRADTIYFGGGTPSLLEPAEIGALDRAPAARRSTSTPDAEITIEANPETVTRRPPRRRTARPASTASASVSSRSATRNCGGSGASTMPRARERAFARGARGGLRQRQPRPDAVAAGADARAPGRVARRRSIDARARTRVALPARAVSRTRRCARRWRAAGWSLAPDDDAADMYLRAMARLEDRRLRAVRDLERGAARPRVAAQPEVLDRRRVARVRLRCALDSRPRPVEQCSVHRRVPRAHRIRDGRPSPTAARCRRANRSRRRCSWGCGCVDGVSTRRIRRRRTASTCGRPGGASSNAFVDAGLLVHAGGRLRLTREGMLLSNEVMTAFLEGGSTVK